MKPVRVAKWASLASQEHETGKVEYNNYIINMKILQKDVAPVCTKKKSLEK